MRIAVFIYGLTGGGATRRVVSLAKGWNQAGHRVDLVVVEPRGPLLPEIGELNLIPLDFGPLQPLLGFLSRRLRVFLSRFPLARYLRQNPVDLFLSAANHAHLTALAARRLSKTSVPLILRLSNHLSGSLGGQTGFRGLKAKRRLGLIKRHYPEADFIVAVCQAVLEDLLKLIPYPREKTSVIYNPIEIEKIRILAREPTPHPWFNPKTTPIILGAGRLSPQKDFATLIRALGHIKDLTSARLIILGEGKERKKLVKLARSLGLLERVDLPGFSPNPWAYMARADVFVLSSRWEGLPGVLLEALAVGCPVISTDCPGGAREILEDGRLGPLVPVGHPAILGQALLQILENPPSRETLEKRAETFSLTKAVSQYLAVFERVRAWKKSV